MEPERRFIPIEGIEARDGEDGARGIKGVAALYNTSTIVGGMFEERIAPGAFDEAMKKDDVRGLFNHNPDWLLSTTGDGSLRLRSSAKGLEYEMDLDAEDFQAKSVARKVETGKLKGNSFSFSVDNDDPERVSWEDRSEEGKLPLRTILSVNRLHDVGPVTFPQYTETTVSSRCEQRAKDLAPLPTPPAPTVDVEIEREKLRLAEAEA